VLDKLNDPPPVIVVIADAYDHDAIRRRDKIFGFVQKPVPSSTLVALIGKAIGAANGVSFPKPGETLQL